jgi:phosphatidylglycerophosphate synthase
MTMAEITASYNETKRNNERFDLWLYHVGRRFSWPVAWAAINLGVTATGVTFISAFFVWAGAALIALGNPAWQIAGALFFQLWIIFDCADGTVARATGTGSKRGEYADAFGGYSVSMLLYSSMGIAAARAVLGLETVLPAILTLSGLSGLLGGGAVGVGSGVAGAGAAGTGAAVAGAGAAPALSTLPALSAGSALDFIPLSTVLPAMALLLAGVGASMFSLYARLLYQKFLNIFEEQAAKARPIKPRQDRTNPVMVAAQNLAANSGFALPLAVIALAGGYEGVYVLGYLIVNAGMLVLTVRRTLTKKATAGLEGPGIELDIAGPGAAGPAPGSDPAPPPDADGPSDRGAAGPGAAEEEWQ